MNANLEGLKDRFDIMEKDGVYKIYCKKCDAGWQLDTRQGLHPGNILHLLNHAAGHRAKKGKRS